MTEEYHNSVVYMPLVPSESMLTAVAQLLLNYYPESDIRDLTALGYSLYVTFLNNVPQVEFTDDNHDHGSDCDCADT